LQGIDHDRISRSGEFILDIIEVGEEVLDRADAGENVRMGGPLDEFLQLGPGTV
jgi:hypothetical protein